MIDNSMGIYIHIPFCARKCEYCDFLSQISNKDKIDQYVEALLLEIKGYAGKKYPISSIFFGGGTPSIISGTQILKIVETIRAGFDVREGAEITLEANPGTVDEKKLLNYKVAGINRLSFGLQSGNNKELKALGRIHTYEEFVTNYELARSHGFDNINVDLMSGLPGQTVDAWEDTLSKIIKLKPEHISAYGLIIEEGTPFYQLYSEDEERRERGMTPRILPSEEQERSMYEVTKSRLSEHGYERYEISNYAKSGYECKHNIIYWKRGNYLGFGLGAASLMDESRLTNETDLDDYIKQKMELVSVNNSKEQVLSRVEQMEEFMFLGLRLVSGININQFENKFGVSLGDVYGDKVSRLVEKGLLYFEADNLRLSNQGIDVSNYVLVEFLID